MEKPGTAITRACTHAAKPSSATPFAFGQYHAIAKVRRAKFTVRFRVSAYRPPTFVVKTSPPPSRMFAGDSGVLTISARYLFGAPLSAAKVRWRLVRDKAAFTPPGQQGFTFDDWHTRSVSSTLASGIGKLDASGTLKLKRTFDAPKDAVTAAHRFSLSAHVFAPNRQEVFDRLRFVVLPAQLLVGLRPERWAVRARRPMKISTVVTDAAGNRRAGRLVTVRAFARKGRSSYYHDRLPRAASYARPEAPRTVC